MIYAFIIGVFYIFALSFYMVLTLLGKLFVFALNFFVPDPLPYIDEIFMVFGIMKNIESIMRITEKIDDLKYKIKSF